MADIGKRIKARREELEMTQEELAKALGYKSKTTIAKIEVGVNDITQSKVVEFAKALKTTPAYIMGWKETGKTDSDSIKIIDEENNIVVLDDDALALIDSLRARPEMKMLFSVSKNATTEDILKAVKIIEALKDN